MSDVVPAPGRLLGAVRGHVVRRRLLAASQRGSALRGGLQGEQKEVKAKWTKRSKSQVDTRHHRTSLGPQAALWPVKELHLAKKNLFVFGRF